jgi:hypothetical protein
MVTHMCVAPFGIVSDQPTANFLRTVKLILPLTIDASGISVAGQPSEKGLTHGLPYPPHAATIRKATACKVFSSAPLRVKGGAGQHAKDTDCPHFPRIEFDIDWLADGLRQVCGEVFIS